MDYLDKAEKEIRDRWFEKHEVKSITGEEGFQQIIWGEKGTSMYQVKYVLSGNNVFISGDLGEAVYSLTCAATLENINGFNLSYFTGKLTAHSRDRWNFDEKLAKKEIREHFTDWCDVDSVSDLEDEDSKLCRELLEATGEWSLQNHFESAVYSIYQQTSVDWFDSETASCIAGCGKRLPLSFIAYWLGLQMVIEQLEKAKGVSA